MEGGLYNDVFLCLWCVCVCVCVCVVLCPCPGTPEVGGLTPVQALEIVRGLRGLNIVGGDVVEVSRVAD